MKFTASMLRSVGNWPHCIVLKALKILILFECQIITGHKLVIAWEDNFSPFFRNWVGQLPLVEATRSFVFVFEVLISYNYPDRNSCFWRTSCLLKSLLTIQLTLKLLFASLFWYIVHFHIVRQRRAVYLFALSSICVFNFVYTL